ncbi:MAG: ADP-ribosylglycohydrolase family protein [Bacteroidota bacterium]
MSKEQKGLTTRSRYRGCLLGLAAGDALGTTLEFEAPGTFTPITDLVGGGPFGLTPGQWTDDTSMALCLAASLVEHGFDPGDQMARYVRWKRDGYWSSTGACSYIGMTVSRALSNFSQTGYPFCGPTHEWSAGNGSLMRLAPVPMFFAPHFRDAVAHSADMSRTTHGATEAVDACRYYAGLLVGALGGVAKADLLRPFYAPTPGFWDDAPLAPKVAAVAAGSFLDKEPPQIRGTGYVVEAMEAALWAFATTDTFEAGALRAVNLGDDADTTGAIYGQLAGAHYGDAAIPATWRDCLAYRTDIERLAEALYEHSGYA